MGNGYHLNISGRLFAVNHSKRKLPEQELASLAWARRPTLRSLKDLREGAINFSIKLQSGIGTSLKVPVKGCVIFGGFSMKLG